MNVCRTFRNQVKMVKTLDFTDFDDLIDCAVMLCHRQKRRLTSRLYQMPEGYRLVLLVGSCTDLIGCGEFGKLQSGNAVTAAYTEEYGKLLIAEHAVKKLGSSFTGRSV